MARAAATNVTANAGFGRCLLDLDRLTADQIRTVLRRAHEFAQLHPGERLETLRGRSVANLFFEDSTRTRVSFSVAARRLGADVFDLTSKGSSVSKGETVADTALTVEAMGVDALVVRHAASGAVDLVANAVQCAVLNAGDGRHAHPTQGLLDALVFATAHRRCNEFDFSGLRIAIVGDLANSRVARSDIAVFSKLGASVVCAGPENLAPRHLEALGCRVTNNLDEALDGCDGVQMLRVQLERGAALGSAREYTRRFQLNGERAAGMKPGAIVMHPGPMNRDVEITSEVADGERSRILAQVAAGVPVRMAALTLAIEAMDTQPRSR